MAAIMQNFAANPSAGLRFFDSPERQTFYFNDRDWTQDGYKSIAMAAEGISTDADNLARYPELTTTIASSFIDQVANSEGFNAEDAKDASPYVAELLKFYMPAVDQALRNGEQEGTAGSVPFTLEHFGSFDHYPEFFRDDLDAVMQVAMGTEDGMTSIAEGGGSFQQTQLNKAAGLVPLPAADKIGELGSKALEFGWSQATDLGTDAAGEHFTSEAAGATDNAETRAEQGSDRVKINAYLALVEAGVIPRDDVPDHWFDNGSLIDASDIDPSETSQFTQSG